MQRLEEKELDDILGKTEPMMPSMRFTKNVMEAIEHREVVAVSKKHITPLVVKLAFAIPILSIAILSIYIMFGPSSEYMLIIKNTSFLTASIIFINIILILALVDKLLSGKKRLKQLLEE